MKRVFLFENHNQALSLWKKNKFHNLDLIHLDAHIDFKKFRYPSAADLLAEATSRRELIDSLRRTAAFLNYKKHIDSQVNVGNYLFPAMRDKIVKNLYWVIPGENQDFIKGLPLLKNIFGNLPKRKIHLSGDPDRRYLEIEGELIAPYLGGHKFIICTLKSLPSLKASVLLDIDADFLIFSYISDGKEDDMGAIESPWILPKQLFGNLKLKIKNISMVTIAYSVIGGYTPLKFRNLGEEMAYYFSPKKYRRRYFRGVKARDYFRDFLSCGERKYYWKAAKIDEMYRSTYNNQGDKYMLANKLSLAEKEFKKILSVDSKNPAALCGLAKIALHRHKFFKAEKLFRKAFAFCSKKIFINERKDSILGLGKALFYLGNYKEAKKFLYRYICLEPVEFQPYFLLGKIFEKENNYYKAACAYKEAMRMNFGDMKIIVSFIRVLPRLHNKKKDLISYISANYTSIKNLINSRYRPAISKKINANEYQEAKKLRNRISLFEKRLTDFCKNV